MADDSCGTPRAYDRHLRRGEKPDAACRAANTAYKRERRAAPPAGLPEQQRAARAAVAERVIADYAAGAGLWTIAEELGRSRAFVRRILTEADVTLRSGPDARAVAGRYRRANLQAKAVRLLRRTFECDVPPDGAATPERYARLAVDALSAAGLLPRNTAPAAPRSEHLS